MTTQKPPIKPGTPVWWNVACTGMAPQWVQGVVSAVVYRWGGWHVQLRGDIAWKLWDGRNFSRTKPVE